MSGGLGRVSLRVPASAVPGPGSSKPCEATSSWTAVLQATRPQGNHKGMGLEMQMSRAR